MKSPRIHRNSRSAIETLGVIALFALILALLVPRIAQAIRDNFGHVRTDDSLLERGTNIVRLGRNIIYVKETGYRFQEVLTNFCEKHTNLVLKQVQPDQVEDGLWSPKPKVIGYIVTFEPRQETN